MDFFSIGHVAFQVLGYPVSYIELTGTLFGLISVYYAARANVLTWPTGIFNEVALFILFFQVQLYADMFLQVFFLVVTIFGWYNWKMNTTELPISRLGDNAVKVYSVMLITGTVLMGMLISRLHLWLPSYFPLPAAYPYIDSFVMVASILATLLLAKKRIETWILWIALDVVCVVLYLVKGIYFLSLEYVIFLGLAYAGWLQWRKKLQYD